MFCNEDKILQEVEMTYLNRSCLGSSVLPEIGHYLFSEYQCSKKQIFQVNEKCISNQSGLY